MSHSREQPTVLVGRIRKPHGVRGEVSVEVLSDVRERFAVGGVLILRAGGRVDRRVEIVSSRRKGELRIVGFEGFASRDDVETLRGALLEVKSSEVPPAPAGSFYHYELVGCTVSDASAGELGEVIDVIEDGGGWLLEVERGPVRLLVPFVTAYLKRVDIAARRIEIDLPAELIELCTSTS